jgi:hypothetical protein
MEINEFAGELRDSERAITLWNRKASEFGRPPPATEFDFSWISSFGYRFVVCYDLLVQEDSVLFLYGPAFAKLLDLPKRPPMNVPLMRQLPERYRSLFADGCSEAIEEASPVRFSGEIGNKGLTELYRASFMPLRMSSPTLHFVYGTFNYSTGRPAAVSEPFITARRRFVEAVQMRLVVPARRGS